MSGHHISHTPSEQQTNNNNYTHSPRPLQQETSNKTKVLDDADISSVLDGVPGTLNGGLIEMPRVVLRFR